MNAHYYLPERSTAPSMDSKGDAAPKGPRGFVAHSNRTPLMHENGSDPGGSTTPSWTGSREGHREKSSNRRLAAGAGHWEGRTRENFQEASGEKMIEEREAEKIRKQGSGSGEKKMREVNMTGEVVSGESEDLKKENVVALENNVVLLLLLIDDTFNF